MTIAEHRFTTFVIATQRGERHMLNNATDLATAEDYATAQFEPASIAIMGAAQTLAGAEFHIAASALAMLTKTRDQLRESFTHADRVEPMLDLVESAGTLATDLHELADLLTSASVRILAAASYSEINGTLAA
ncbi:hypothetical protein [Mesorhizobium cantuariense]|uniref:Uncharacterized protein n=1 Tax=Mesorhizobium cantuariense TaxID=1300275 RepID=A0ABV7MJW2_9HYPH